jgi:hypothetical protein
LERSLVVRKFGFVILVLFSLGVVACGEDAEEGSDPSALSSDAPLTGEDMCSVIREAHRQQSALCDSYEPTQGEQEVFERACEELFGQSVRAGAISLDGAQLRGCLQDTATDCRADVLSVCIEVALEGALEAEAGCRSDLECVSGACKQNDPCEVGVCEAEPGVGEACGEEGRCASGLVCNQEQVCQGRAQEGEDCSEVPCDTFLDCAASSDGLRCRAYPEAAQEGDPCQEGVHPVCGAGLFCFHEQGSGLIGACRAHAELGQACPVGRKFHNWSRLGCVNGAVCQVEPGQDMGVCVQPQEGDPCVSWGEDYEPSCGRGLTCDEGSGLCVQEVIEWLGCQE